MATRNPHTYPRTLGPSRGPDKFTRGYIEALFWSSTDDEGEPLDNGNYELSDEAREIVDRDCQAFQRKYGDLLAEAQEAGGPDDERAGHDFWLTRNGHGAGFWDGDWPEPYGKKLTAAAKSFGEQDPYVGDDGEVYLSGGRAVNPNRTYAPHFQLPSAPARKRYFARLNGVSYQGRPTAVLAMLEADSESAAREKVARDWKANALHVYVTPWSTTDYNTILDAERLGTRLGMPESPDDAVAIYYLVRGSKENPEPRYLFKIKGLPSEREFAAMPFGRQIEYLRAMERFKETAKTVHISQKRQTLAKALKEFKQLYQPTEYLLVDTSHGVYKDDSVQVWYKSDDALKKEQNPRPLPSTINSPAIARRIERAFRALHRRQLPRSARVEPFYEHGSWFVILHPSGATYSVHDAAGHGEGTWHSDGFSFELLSSGIDGEDF